MSDIAAAAGSEVYGAADFFSFCQRQLRTESVHIFLYLLFHRSLQLLSQTIDNFNSVVIIGIVAGGDHNAAVKPLCPDHIGNTGGSGHMEQIGVRAGSRQTCRQRILKHIAGAAGILSNDNFRFMLPPEIPSQVAPHLVGMFYRKIYIGFSPEAVGSEIFTHTLCLPILTYALSCRFASLAA